MIRRPTYASLQILREFVRYPKQYLCGIDIIKSTGLSSGTVHPILASLKRQGILESFWEEENPRILGRPRKHFYRMTQKGNEAAKKIFESLN